MTIGRAVRFCTWRSRHIPDNVYLAMVATFVGAVAGCAAHLLKILISHLADFVRPDMHAGSLNIWLLILPIIGILLTGIYVRYILKIDIYKDVTVLINELQQHQRPLPAKLMVAPIIANTLTLGMGGSAGPDNPIAYASAAIGNNFGRWFLIPRSARTLMTACGAGSGIAGIFTAPVAGLLYTVEVVKYPINRVGVILLSLCSLTSGIIAFILAGMSFDVTFDYSGLPSWEMLAIGVGLGCFCGLYSFYYSYSKDRVEKYFVGIQNRWKANVLSGLSVGVMVMLFPVLFSMGYDTIIGLINGNDSTMGADFPFYGGTISSVMMIALGCCVLLLKSLANGATMSGGGVAGEFTPSLFAGAVTGFVFALACKVCFGLEIPLPIFALMGMAGVMAGVIAAPLTAIFITIEMSGAYHYFLPITLVAVVSIAVKKYLDYRLVKAGYKVDVA
ncbi:MAG: chloride channel protein [Muribaculaceae bacterium]|nr:chloride channel protein [Muribaculaceae bacterium]MDE6642881.1 chloride channel protein [Muribaculaceae bacterium]